VSLSAALKLDPDARPPFVRRALLTLALLAFGAAAALVGAVRCPIALVLGIPCPSCGTTRAARSMLELDIAGAFRVHPVAPIVLVCLALLAARSVWLVAKDGHARAVGEGRAGRALLGLLVAAAAAEVLVWVVRWFGLLGGPVAV
jgi:hypothetical protein